MLDCVTLDRETSSRFVPRARDGYRVKGPPSGNVFLRARRQQTRVARGLHQYVEKLAEWPWDPTRFRDDCHEIPRDLYTTHQDFIAGTRCCMKDAVPGHRKYVEIVGSRYEEQQCFMRVDAFLHRGHGWRNRTARVVAGQRCFAIDQILERRSRRLQRTLYSDLLRERVVVSPRLVERAFERAYANEQLFAPDRAGE